jgi:hypothetical protein
MLGNHRDQIHTVQPESDDVERMSVARRDRKWDAHDR